MEYNQEISKTILKHSNSAKVKRNLYGFSDCFAAKSLAYNHYVVIIQPFKMCDS